MNKTIHIKRSIDIEITVPMNETQQETEQWIDCNFRADGTLEKVDMNHIIRDGGCNARTAFVLAEPLPVSAA